MTISASRKFKTYCSLFFLNSFKLKYILKTIQKAYQTTPSYSMSKHYRVAHEPTNPDLIYGELSISAFLYLCALIPKHINFKIYDLGCGDARLLLATTLYFRNLEAIGIEKIADLQIAASSIALSMQAQIAKNNSTLSVVEDNFFQRDFSDADIVYINAAAMSEETWQELHSLFEKLKVGSHIITVTRKLETQLFSLIYAGIHEASWGNARVYIYLKIK